MILRVDVDNVAATIELDREPWTPEFLETILRMCSAEVVRTAIALGAAFAEYADEDDHVPDGE